METYIPFRDGSGRRFCSYLTEAEQHLSKALLEAFWEARGITIGEGEHVRSIPGQAHLDALAVRTSSRIYDLLLRIRFGDDTRITAAAESLAQQCPPELAVRSILTWRSVSDMIGSTDEPFVAKQALDPAEAMVALVRRDPKAFCEWLGVPVEGEVKVLDTSFLEAAGPR